jgi:hypothetical protein
MSGKPLSDEEYDKLKREIIKKISRSNAQDVFNAAIDTLLQQIITLDINDISQIERFYLTSLELIRAGNFLLAEKKAFEENVGFDKAGLYINFDDTTNLLLSVFNKSIHQHHFIKIKSIEEKYKPGIQEWAQIHAYCLTIATGLLQEPRVFTLTKVIDEKVSFLKIKANEFKDDDDMVSCKFVTFFADNIQKYTEQFLDDCDGAQFTIRMTSAIAASRSTLEQQPWWKDLIDDIANALVSVFRKEPSRFTLFANPAKQELDELQMSIQPPKLSPS